MRVGADWLGLNRLPTTCVLSLIWLRLGVCFKLGLPICLDLDPEAFPFALLPPFLLFFPPTLFWVCPSTFPAPLRLPDDLLGLPKPPFDLADSLLFLSASSLGPISPAFFAVPLDLGTSLEIDTFLLLGFSLGVASFLDISFPRATPSDPEYCSSSGEQEAENHQSQISLCWLKMVPLGQRKEDLPRPLRRVVQM